MRRLLPLVCLLFVQAPPPRVMTGDQYVARINKARLLKAGPILTQLAQEQAEQCALADKLLDGADFDERIFRRAGREVDAAEVAAQLDLEDILQGNQSFEAALLTWLDSDEHRRILRGDFTHVGIAYADAIDGSRFWVATFAR